MGKQEEIREGIQRLWCQHCKALQKANGVEVECWYNPLTNEVQVFCAANEDAVDAIFGDMNARGVVVRMDRKLPTVSFTLTGNMTPTEVSKVVDAYRKAYAGYEKVESLI